MWSVTFGAGALRSIGSGPAVRFAIELCLSDTPLSGSMVVDMTSRSDGRFLMVRQETSQPTDLIRVLRTASTARCERLLSER